MSPEIKLALLIGSLALLLTVHLVIVLGLFGKAPTAGTAGRLEGLLGLALPPAAPVLAWRRGSRIRAVLWGAFALLYGVLFVIARWPGERGPW